MQEAHACKINDDRTTMQLSCERGARRTRGETAVRVTTAAARAYVSVPLSVNCSVTSMHSLVLSA